MTKFIHLNFDVLSEFERKGERRVSSKRPPFFWTFFLKSYKEKFLELSFLSMFSENLIKKIFHFFQKKVIIV
jgi:hypothetical protein